MIVVVAKLDGSGRYCITGVERIEENDNLDVVLVTEHSEDVVVHIDSERLDIVGVG